MKIKLILGVLLLLVVLCVVAVLIVGAHLGDIVKAGMETAGPKVTQTTLTVDSVNVSLLAGSAGVKNLVLGNPEGFKAPQSIDIGNASVSLAPGSVLSDKIIIHSIKVQSPEITFEGNPLGDNNLKKILDNVESFSGAAKSTGTNAAPASPTEKKAAKKLEVDDFEISGAKVHANLTGLVNQDITVTIPDIHLTGLGTGPDGITAADLTKTVLTEITSQTIKTLLASVSSLGKDVTGAAKKAAEDALGGAVKNAGPAGSNTVDQLKRGLGGLLGK